MFLSYKNTRDAEYTRNIDTGNISRMVINFSVRYFRRKQTVEFCHYLNSLVPSGNYNDACVSTYSCVYILCIFLFIAYKLHCRLMRKEQYFTGERDIGLIHFDEFARIRDKIVKFEKITRAI